MAADNTVSWSVCTVVTVTVTYLGFKRYHAVEEKAGNTEI